MYSVSSIIGNSVSVNQNKSITKKNPNFNGFIPSMDFLDRDKFEKIGLGKISIPEFSSAKQYVKLDEIKNFHKNLKKQVNGDRIAYKFYSTMKDVGSGRYVLALPIDLAKNNETKFEMLKEVKRLMSSSQLSQHEKAMLEHLYKSYQTKATTT